MTEEHQSFFKKVKNQSLHMNNDKINTQEKQKDMLCLLGK